MIWVDEKAHDVARLEAYFVGDVHIGGGLLANLQKGTSFVFEQGYINNEVWLPTYDGGPRWSSRAFGESVPCKRCHTLFGLQTV